MQRKQALLFSIKNANTTTNDAVCDSTEVLPTCDCHQMFLVSACGSAVGTTSLRNRMAGSTVCSKLACLSDTSLSTLTLLVRCSRAKTTRYLLCVIFNVCCSAPVMELCCTKMRCNKASRLLLAQDFLVHHDLAKAVCYTLNHFVDYHLALLFSSARCHLVIGSIPVRSVGSLDMSDPKQTFYHGENQMSRILTLLCRT